MKEEANADSESENDKDIKQYYDETEFKGELDIKNRNDKEIEK